MSCQLMDIWNMDLSHIPLAVRPSAHLSTYHRTFFQSRLTYGFVATPIYSKELEGDSCFASIHPANRNKIQYTNMKQFLNWNKNERHNLVWKIRNRKHVALANAVSFSRMFTTPRPTMEPKPLWWDIWILFRFMKYF